MNYQLSDFDYELPEHLVANEPAPERSSSRLMVLETPELVAHRIFKDIELLISSNDLLVFNDTRVMKARLYGQKPTGGRVELLVESVSDQPHQAWAHIKASHAPQAGSSFEVAGKTVHALERRDSLGLLALEEGESWYDLMDQSGALPLPPYMHKEPNEQDEVRYQTVYAKQLGAVAAPTAGLHFDDNLLQTLL
jgi:S-adenosylmethionine:tRNA ribosyltransferase-isomerase